MKYQTPINKNYCATVVKLDKFIDLPNCDNIKQAIIFGNSVIVEKTSPVGIMGLYFPVETKLSPSFLSANNLYKKAHLNENTEEKGFFEDSGRIKCVKFRGHKSEGFFIPLFSSLSLFAGIQELLTIKEGDEFDYINNQKICEKYVIKSDVTNGRGSGKSDTRISRIVPEQFRLHVDTSNLRKSIGMINPDDVISITYKMHGTSSVTSKILTNRKLTWLERFAEWWGVKIKKTEYDVVYSSRRVIKNEYESKTNLHYYGIDIWNIVRQELQDSIMKGITLYTEIVGYLPSGEAIQSGYDYGCNPGEHATYVHRITSTNVDGKVIEFTWGQVKDYCLKYGLKHVSQLYYGKAKYLFPIGTENHWHETFLKMAEELYLDKDCFMCANKVPEEGVVLKVDKTFDCEPYKLKSFRFLERESKELDAGIADIETQQSET